MHSLPPQNQCTFDHSSESPESGDLFSPERSTVSSIDIGAQHSSQSESCLRSVLAEAQSLQMAGAREANSQGATQY